MKKFISILLAVILIFSAVPLYSLTGIAAMKLSTPELKNVYNTISGAAIIWTKVDKANGYYVYRKTSGGLTKIATVKGNSNRLYVDTAVKSGKVYCYTVKAYNADTVSSYDKYGLKTMFLSAPKLSSASNASKGSSIKWQKVSAAKSYAIYRKSSSGSYTKIATVSGSKLSYTDKSVKSGVVYTYSVKAINGFYESAYRKSGLKIKVLPVTSLKSAVEITSGIQLKWSKVAGASGYYIYRKTVGDWSKIAVIKSGKTLYYTDKKIGKGITYTYTVKAYSGSYISAASKSRSCTAKKCSKILSIDEVENTVPAKIKAVQKSNLKIGIILLHDKYSTYDSRIIDSANTVRNKYSLRNSQIVFKENIGESSDCYDAAVELVESGCNVVFGASFGYESYFMKAAKKYPNVQFCLGSGFSAKTALIPNYHSNYSAVYESRYLTGVAAGMKLNEMIANKKITASQAKLGFVGAFSYAEVISSYTAFYLGAKSVCPSVTMSVENTGSWYDISGESHAAAKLINVGCVIISQYSDSYGAPSLCQKQGIPNIAFGTDLSSIYPETALISSSICWAPYLELVIGSMLKGRSIPSDWCGGIANGSATVSAVNTLVAANGTQAKLDRVANGIKAGKINVFDTSAFTVNGKTITSYKADVVPDTSFIGDTQVIFNGCFNESTKKSYPYFDLYIDNIKVLNERY